MLLICLQSLDASLILCRSVNDATVFQIQKSPKNTGPVQIILIHHSLIFMIFPMEFMISPREFIISPMKND
jgi:hypothetical protein